jgi:hypothetical protein
MSKNVKNKSLFAANLSVVLIQKQDTLMRTTKQFLLILAIILNSLSAKSQVILTIDTLLNFPDSAVAGQTYFPTTIVRNAGLTPFQGTLQIGFQTQNPVGSIGFLYFNNNPISLAANDTVLLTPTNGFIFDTTFFRPGNNVVVVWPVVTQLVAQIDTVTTDVFLLTTSGLSSPTATTLLLSPVPAHDYLYVRSTKEISIEHVRIYDAAGREFPVESRPLENGLREIYLGGLPSGNYIIETLFRNSTPLRGRFIRVH